ncbi:hypothetical protein BC567DRAFT_153944 [Phyllosticta citribraziliensis]
MSAQPRFAFFGSTGGCVAAALALALKCGNACSALVRNEEKLKKMLVERGVEEATLSKHLLIVTGNIKDVAAVSKTLKPEGAPSAVDVAICGVGSLPVFKPNPLKPTLEDPTICQDATKTILEAARAVGGQPHLLVISSAGLTDKGRDVPLVMAPLYYWLLAVPHADKKAMEKLIEADFAKPASERAIKGYTIVRPTFFTDGPSCGLDSVRVGSEEEPAIGYTVSRNDVGLWVFENAVKKAQELDGGKVVYITY